MVSGRKGRTVWAVGFDLGGTNMRGALVSSQGDVRARRSRKTEATRGADAIIEDIVSLIREVLAEAPKEVVGIGMAAPGPLNPEEGLIIRSPNLRWANVPLKRRLEEDLGIQTVVDNDSQMTAFGERWMGAGQGADHLLCVTLGTGVGGGIILDGRIYHGESGSAGHIGHYIIDPQGPLCGCGARGCLEAYASAPSIVRRTIEAIKRGRVTGITELAAGDLDRLTCRDVSRAAQKGDPLALNIFKETGHYLALVLASVVPILDPKLVVISGQVAQAGDLLIEPLTTRLQGLIRLRPPVPIVRGWLGDDGGLIGAAGVVFTQAGLLK